MANLYDLKSELNLIDPNTIRLHIDEFQDLNLIRKDGTQIKVATVLRAFPVSADNRFILLKDENDQEIGSIPDADQLAPDSRAALQSKLDLLYFTAKITQINAIDEEFHVPKWDVETDRGPRVFELGSSRRDIRILSGGRILIRDADGNRYEIPDYRKLDAISQSMIETIL